MRNKFQGAFIILLIILSCVGCGANKSVTETGEPAETSDEVQETEEKEETQEEKEEMEKKHTSALKPVKTPTDNNPVMTQHYSADPYAIVYDGRVYLYMTGDTTMYNADGSIKTNDYSNIDIIRVISSDDLVNWTDHGAIHAAGRDGAANWGNNSWAPAACWKMVDGKPKFFLYFANSGNGIAVLTSDSPTGPFVDPLGEALVSRKTPTCSSVTWLFDPAVLIDDDGTGYLYFGGGVPGKDKISNPGTARVVKLADDMIHLDGDPVPIENVLYLFEDSGINKIGDKYIYSYCSNFDVPKSGCEGYGFGQGEIITMVGDSPMGPFETVGSILKNPEFFFEYGGNNHHCMFEFQGKWYVTYHASLIEEKNREKYGYRSVNIDEISITEDGLFASARGTTAGVTQVKSYNPFEESSFRTMSNQSGLEISDAECPVVAEDGAFIQITGADCKSGANACKVVVKAPEGGSVSVRCNLLNGEDAGRTEIPAGNEFAEYTVSFDETVSDIRNIYFVFEGSGMELDSWKFVD